MTTPPVIAADPLAACPPLMRWLLERIAPEDDALTLLDPRQPIEALYANWIAKGQLSAALRLIAGVLPTRESVWWAWVSARYASQLAGAAAPSAAVHAALSAIEQWIVRPDDDARRAAWDAGNAAGLDTPVGMVAAAVFLSGTTVAPPTVPPVPPPPGAALPLISGAILLSAAANSKPEQIAPTMSAFAAQGLEIVKRLGGWGAALQLAYDTHQRLAQDYARATAPPSAPAAR
ncbi:MAG: DUF6931 family protein [Gemmatimonas sp.]|uniref:DUF6931 family protein n=1 Tax=Gemmatimonas sp. TaxID=1962908 RepID=UPI00391F8A6C